MMSHHIIIIIDDERLDGDIVIRKIMIKSMVIVAMMRTMMMMTTTMIVVETGGRYNHDNHSFIIIFNCGFPVLFLFLSLFCGFWSAATADSCMEVTITQSYFSS